MRPIVPGDSAERARSEQRAYEAAGFANLFTQSPEPTLPSDFTMHFTLEALVLAKWAPDLTLQQCVLHHTLDALLFLWSSKHTLLFDLTPSSVGVFVRNRTDVAFKLIDEGAAKQVPWKRIREQDLDRIADNSPWAKALVAHQSKHWSSDANAVKRLEYELNVEATPELFDLASVGHLYYKNPLLLGSFNEQREDLCRTNCIHMTAMYALSVIVFYDLEPTSVDLSICGRIGLFDFPGHISTVLRYKAANSRHWGSQVLGDVLGSQSAHDLYSAFSRLQHRAGVATDVYGPYVRVNNFDAVFAAGTHLSAPNLEQPWNRRFNARRFVLGSSARAAASQLLLDATASPRVLGQFGGSAGNQPAPSSAANTVTALRMSGEAFDERLAELVEHTARVRIAYLAPPSSKKDASALQLTPERVLAVARSLQWAGAVEMPDAAMAVFVVLRSISALRMCAAVNCPLENVMHLMFFCVDCGSSLGMGVHKSFGYVRHFVHLAGGEKVVSTLTTQEKIEGAVEAAMRNLKMDIDTYGRRHNLSLFSVCTPEHAFDLLARSPKRAGDALAPSEDAGDAQAPSKETGRSWMALVNTVRLSDTFALDLGSMSVRLLLQRTFAAMRFMEQKEPEETAPVAPSAYECGSVLLAPAMAEKHAKDLSETRGREYKYNGKGCFVTDHGCDSEHKDLCDWILKNTSNATGSLRMNVPLDARVELPFPTLQRAGKLCADVSVTQQMQARLQAVLLAHEHRVSVGTDDKCIQVIPGLGVADSGAADSGAADSDAVNPETQLSTPTMSPHLVFALGACIAACIILVNSLPANTWPSLLVNGVSSTLSQLVTPAHGQDERALAVVPRVTAEMTVVTVLVAKALSLGGMLSAQIVEDAMRSSAVPRMALTRLFRLAASMPPEVRERDAWAIEYLAQKYKVHSVDYMQIPRQPEGLEPVALVALPARLMIMPPQVLPREQLVRQLELIHKHYGSVPTPPHPATLTPRVLPHEQRLAPHDYSSGPPPPSNRTIGAPASPARPPWPTPKHLLKLAQYPRPGPPPSNRTIGVRPPHATVATVGSRQPVAGSAISPEDAAGSMVVTIFNAAMLATIWGRARGGRGSGQ